jgi:drug/metabolite transporter (DMT)-like permease
LAYPKEVNTLVNPKSRSRWTPPAYEGPGSLTTELSIRTMTTKESTSYLLPPGLALTGAVVAISFAGPLVRFSTADALVISAWRLLFSVGIICIILLARGSFLKGVRLTGREWLLGIGAGLLLAGHFWAWVASIQLTTIASSSVLVSTQPLFVAGLSVAFLKESPSLRQWSGILVAILGAGVIGWGDLALGGKALMGDALALSAGMMSAGYFTIGRSLRKKLDLWAYTGLVYGAAALPLALAVLLTPSVPLTGYSLQNWMVFLGLAAVPMMLGHTGINYSLRYLPAYVANLASLGEPVGATLIAWLLPGIREVPPSQTLLGGALVLMGIALGTIQVRSRSS